MSQLGILSKMCCWNSAAVAVSSAMMSSSEGGRFNLEYKSVGMFNCAAAAGLLGLFQHLLWNQGKPQKTLVGIVGLGTLSNVTFV